MSHLEKPSAFASLVFGLIFVLFFIWQMPGTIALRNGVLLLLLLSLIVVWVRESNTMNIPRLLTQPPMLCLWLLTGWLIVSLSWAVEPTLSLAELKGQWLVPLLCAIFGGVLATVAPSLSQNGFKGLALTVFWALFVQIALHDLLAMAYWLSTGVIPFRHAPVLYLPDIVHNLLHGQPMVTAFSGENGDKFSYVNNMLAAFIIAELFQRIWLKKRWLSIGWPTLLLAGFATLACTDLLRFRNGNIGLMLLITFAAFMMLVRLARDLPLWKTVGMFVVTFTALLALGGGLYKADSRWQGFSETVNIALDTDSYMTGRMPEGPYPTLKNGQPLDASAYLRFVWGKEGLKLVADNPMGSGYNRNAFGDGIDRKYEMNGLYRGGHSHSGLIDFAIANGLPGLTLWFALLGTLFYTGWVAFMGGQIAPGLALMFIVSGFFSRSIVDSNIRDHMLQQFMFLSMFFAVALKMSRPVSGGVNG